MVNGHPLFVTFFTIGTIVFLSGLIWRISIYWRGQWEIAPLVKGVLSTLFSRKIWEFIKTVFWEGILQRRLFHQDKLRWLMKVLIMIGYPGILIAGHIKADVMSQFENIPQALKFLYAPFCDFYYFRDITSHSLPFLDALFALSFDLFGAMILAGEFIAIYRRFVAKTVTFKTGPGDILAVNLLGGWFILRFICEATSILAYSLPGSVAGFWFLSFVLSKIIVPLGLPWSSLNYPLWSISGLFLAMLVACIPFNKKLWHIVTIPLNMFVRLIPSESFQDRGGKAPIPLTAKELVSLDSCVKCGSCVEVCPVYGQTQQLDATMGGFFADFKSHILKAYGLPEAFTKKEEMIVPADYSERSFLCTLCGRCALECPAMIDTKGLRSAARGFVAEKGAPLPAMEKLAETLRKAHNISGEPNEGRPAWAEALNDYSPDMFEKKAKVIYFVGCVASFFPMTKRIPQSFVQVLNRAGVDFTILGGEEWCCGFPLIAAGKRKEAETFMRHNLEKVKEKGGEKLVFACPSCYHTWLEQPKNGMEIFHSTQFVKTLIDEGRIRFKTQEKITKVTYHDPCDLGRASGVYEPPRDILRAIPGVELVEMEGNRQNCKCCGGGGNLEMVRPDLSAAMAKAKIEEIKATGAEMVVTACQQCIRSMQTTARKNKIPLVAMDVVEFVLKNMA
jgi:heterodisulfide reductase subunit D